MEKDKIKELISLLNRAMDNLNDIGFGCSDNFTSVKEFIRAIEKSCTLLKLNNFAVVKNLNYWFSPTNDWDDFNGDEDIGDAVYSIVLDLQGV